MSAVRTPSTFSHLKYSDNESEGGPQMERDEAVKLIAEINDHFVRATMCYSEAARKIKLLYTGRGYRALGYATFRECVTTELGISMAGAYRALQSSIVMANLAGIEGVDELSEYAIRPLGPLTPEEQRQVIGRAKDIAGSKPITNTIVESAKAMVLGKAPDSPCEKTAKAVYRARHRLKALQGILSTAFAEADWKELGYKSWDDYVVAQIIDRNPS